MKLVKQKLKQILSFLIRWSFPIFLRWAFPYAGKLLEMKLPAVKSTRQFITNRIARIPNPSSLWSPDLRARQPLPTNAPWLNFVLNEGSMPEYIHPYLISCKQGALSICYCTPKDTPETIEQVFVPGIIVGSASFNGAPLAKQHMITAFDDLSVTLWLPGDIQVPLVRGCPYITFIFNTATIPTFESAHKVRKLEGTPTHTKYKLLLENKQTWIIYSSEKLLLQPVQPDRIEVLKPYKGNLRVVLLNGGEDAEAVLDKHAATYPVGGKADLSMPGKADLSMPSKADLLVPIQVNYTWGKVGQDPLLMLRLPIHRDMMNFDGNKEPVKIDTSECPSVAYEGIDGRMEAVASDSWVLKTNSFSNEGWDTFGGIQDPKNKEELKKVLESDMLELMPLSENVTSAYIHGKFLARVARMAMIAEGLGSCLHLLTRARNFLCDLLTPWIEGTFGSNGFVYDSKWGGIIMQDKKQRWLSRSAVGVYDDKHYTLGYFCYAGAVLAKLDGAWGEAHKAHLYTLVSDYMWSKSGSRRKNEFELSSPYVFPKLRYFDLWVLHSWAGDGLVESEHGRRQVSSSEAVHAYYAGAMLGSVFKDTALVNMGLTLASLEIKAAQLLWHIPTSSSIYPKEFRSHNRMVGVLWANKRDSFGSPSIIGVRTQTTVAAQRLAPDTSSEALTLPHHLLGMQVPPLLPISEFLFSAAFARELVDWASSPSLSTSLTVDMWKGYIYALESLYKPKSAVSIKAAELSYHDLESSRSILLWWIYSRNPPKENTSH